MYVFTNIGLGQDYLESWSSSSYGVQIKYQQTKYWLVFCPGILMGVAVSTTLLMREKRTWDEPFVTYWHFFHYFRFSKPAPLRKKFLLSSVIPKLCCLIDEKQYTLKKEYTMEMQTEDKLYSCVQCNLSFKMTKDLKMHMLQHDGKKPHSCNQCGFSSINTTDLKRHACS